MSEQLLYQMVDAGQVLGVGRTTMYDIAARGDVEIVHIGRRALVTAASLRAYVDRLRGESEGEVA